MRRYILWILLLLIFTSATRVSAFSPEWYDVISIQFFENNEPVSDGYQVDILLPRDEFNPLWLDEDINWEYQQAFPDYDSFPFMSDTAEYISYRAYHRYVIYEPLYNNDGYIIMEEYIYDYSSFQIVIFDEDDTIIHTSDVMNVTDVFSDSIHQAVGNHYLHYHVDTDELDMIPYEDTTSDPEDMILAIGILAVVALFIAAAPFLLIFFGVALIAFIIMIVWIKSGQQKYPRE